MSLFGSVLSVLLFVPRIEGFVQLTSTPAAEREMDTSEGHRRSSLAVRAAGSKAGHRADEARAAELVREIAETDANQAETPNQAEPPLSMSSADLTATSEGNADMLFLFEVFDISLSVPQVQTLEELKVTNISDLCNLSPANASLLVSKHNFPQHFLAVLWFLDHKRDWMPKDNLSMILADRRTEVSFV